jgi:hypothetical protein
MKRKGQVSIEYIFALIVFFLIFLGIYQAWLINSKLVEDYKTKTKTYTIASNLLNTIKWAYIIGPNTTIKVNLANDKIKKMNAKNQELIFFDDLNNIVGIYKSPSPSINQTQINQINKINVSYNGEKIILEQTTD